MRLLGYLWASPNTLFGIAAGLMLWGRFRLVEGVVEIHGGGVAHVLANLPNPATVSYTHLTLPTIYSV